MDLDVLWRPVDIIGCQMLGRRFVGAQGVGGVLSLGTKLKKQGYKITYNLLGEHVADKRSLTLATETTKKLIGGMDLNNYGNVSCKPTLYGLAVSKTMFADVIGELVELAYKKGIEIEFDAENYEYIPDTFDVFSGLASQRYLVNTVRQAIQAHLKNIESLMDKYKLWDKNLRVVKGSGVYQEQKSAVTQSGFLVIERYLEVLRKNMRNNKTPFAATVRDESLVKEIIRIADDNDRPFEFQMLYGPIGRKLRRRLLAGGHPVRIYVPFTDWWCQDVWRPYGLRRAKMIRRILYQTKFRL